MGAMPPLQSSTKVDAGAAAAEEPIDSGGIVVALGMASAELRVPRYFFDIENGHRLIYPAGIDCASDIDAKQKGTFIARQIAADSPASAARRLAVLDEQRKEVAVLPIGDGALKDKSTTKDDAE
jgi:hypothetical protein